MSNDMLRRCLREPIPEIEAAAQRLNNAVTAHLLGDGAIARRLIREANDSAVRDWVDSLWGKQNQYNRKRRTLGAPPALPKDQRAQPREPSSATKQFVHQRDGYYCRFCHIPVIRSKVREAIRRAYPEEAPWPTRGPGADSGKHAALMCLWAQYDHVLPHSRGGSNDLENIYLTCAGCNYGRTSGFGETFLLEEQDLAHPSLRAPRQDGWDGLERFLTQAPATRAPPS